MTTALNNLTESSYDEIVGERVHRLMWRAKMSQTTLAPLLNMTQGSLSKKLRGERGWSLDEIILTTRALHTTAAYLFGETENPHPHNTGGDNVEPPIGLEPITCSLQDDYLAPVTPLFSTAA